MQAYDMFCLSHIAPTMTGMLSEDVPPEQEHFLAVNAEYAGKWPVISEMKDAPHDADEWAGVPNKYDDHFNPEPGGRADEPEQG